MNCYLCGVKITVENSTFEHIIPNSVGGKLKSKDLICINCNSKFGESLDVELAKQMNVYANMLNIKRERGKPRTLETVHEEGEPVYRILPGGKPELVNPYKIYEKGTEHRYLIPPKKINDFLKKITSDFLKQKQKKIILETGEIKREKLNKELTILLPHYGKKFMTAINKIAINFYIYQQKESFLLHSLIEKLRKNDFIFENVVLYSLESEDEIKEKKLLNVSHKLILKGSKAEKRIYMYIELFSSDSFLISLSNEYEGENFMTTYIYDVISRNEEWNTINNEDFKYIKKDWLTQKDYDIKKAQLDRVFSFILFKQEKDNFLEEFFKKYIETYENITSQNIEEFSHIFAEEFVKKFYLKK